MSTLKTPKHGSPERQSMRGPRLRHPKQRALAERRVLAEGRARLENLPGLDLPCFGKGRVEAAARAVEQCLGRHGIGAAHVVRVTLKGDAALVEIGWLPALERIPGLVRGHGYTALEVSPVCLLAWRKPGEAGHGG